MDVSTVSALNRVEVHAHPGFSLAVAMCCQQSGASVVTNFSGQIIVGLGFSGLQALILQIPGWVCSCGMLLTTGILGTYTSFFRTRKLVRMKDYKRDAATLTLQMILVASCTLAIASLAVLKVYPPGSNVNKGMQLFFISLLNGHTGACKSPKRGRSTSLTCQTPASSCFPVRTSPVRPRRQPSWR